MIFGSEPASLDEFTRSFNEFVQKSHPVFHKILNRPQESLESHAQNFSSVWGEFTKKFLENPQQIVEAQFAYWQAYLKICQNFIGNSGENSLPTDEQNLKNNDKRFRDSQWENNKWFDFIRQNYLLAARHTQSLVKEVVSQSDPKLAKKVNFYTRQFIDAFSPTNFINTNPEVLQSIFQTGGKNLLDGFKQFLGDLEQGNGLPNIKMTDIDYFEIGRNIAITPGKVIYQNEVMQLIQYAPTTSQVNQNPLLIIPPWIKKYYILDLQPENSFVKWLVDKGHSVFLVSWVNPVHQQANKNFAHYMLEGPLCALDVIEKAVGNHSVNVIGYCVGGTLLASTLAYCAAKKDKRINSVTFLTTLLDFSEPGDLGVFIDEYQISALEKHMQKKGYLEGAIIAAAFNSLRANELIWNYFINNYLKGQKPPPFDLLYWNSDETNLPEKLHSYCLREMYLHNHLIQPGALEIEGTPLDLGQITAPSFFLATKEDHIVPWISSYKGMQHLAGSKKFVLAASGHVAGVINPPCKNKYGYWVNAKKPKKPENWLKGAKYQKGSWWNCWQKWLQKYAGGLVPAREFDHYTLEDAPGAYVKVKLADISFENK